MVHENQRIEYYEKLCGDRYSATAYVGKLARKLAEKYNNVITHAEALSWILSGCVPEGVEHYSERLKQREEGPLKFVNESLSNILDEEVKSAVLKSIIDSMKFHHLIYRYTEVYDEYRQARIRILVNKLWDEMNDPDNL